MTTYLQSLMHFVKGTVATGVFSMGIAFKNGGMILALIVTPLMGLLVLHCITILVRVAEMKSKENKVSDNSQENKTFADIVQEVFADGPPVTKFFAKYMKTVIDVQICFGKLGFCCIAIIFVGSNMEKTLRYFDVDLSLYVLMLIFFIPMWLSSLIPNLKFLAPISAIANVMLMISLAFILYFVCDDLPSFNTVNYLAGIDTVPLFLAVALYTYGSITLVIPLRNEMDKPQNLVGPFGVLTVGFFIIIPIVTSLGFFAYFKYGEEIARTVFLNLPEDNKLVQALIILASLQVLFTYPICLYISATIIWPVIEERYGPFKRPVFSLLCFKTALAWSTLAVSEAIPFIDLVISLIGAVCTTCLTLFIPAVIDIIAFYKKDDSIVKKSYLLTKNLLIIAFSVIMFVTGVFISIRDIINSF